jgi:two-component system, cell cycle response regulator DivK
MARLQRILIVDDYEDHRVLLRLQLRKVGTFDILEAADGQQALDFVSQQALDLVIMNLGLPTLNGWEATRRIRALPSPARGVPILAFSAYTLPTHERQARAAGCDDYLTKPAPGPLLRQTVERLLAGGRRP